MKGRSVIRSTSDLSILRQGRADAAVWDFLPARPDRRRVTTPDVIALHTGITTQEAADSLKRLEIAGRIVRDAKLGSRTGWHRATAAVTPSAPADYLFEDSGA